MKRIELTFLMVFCLLAVFVAAATLTRHKHYDGDCHFVPNNENHEYDSYQCYDGKSSVWRIVIGEVTTYIKPQLDGKGNIFGLESENAKWHPKKLKEADEDFLRKVRVIRWQKVENGKYVVDIEEENGFRPVFVWEPELLSAVRQKQQW